MEKQLIISVGREFGSGGHLIAETLAKRFGLTLYDHNILDEIAAERNLPNHVLKRYDEKPKNRLLSRTVNGHSSSIQENLAVLQFNFLRKQAEAGESFVIVGRCAETKLKDFDSLISIFVLGDKKAKIERVMEVYNLTEQEAQRKAERSDAKRKIYHNDHCSGKKWGDSRNYDISINSSKLGIEKTIDMLEDYIKQRLEMR